MAGPVALVLDMVTEIADPEAAVAAYCIQSVLVDREKMFRMVVDSELTSRAIGMQRDRAEEWRGSSADEGSASRR